MDGFERELKLIGDAECLKALRRDPQLKAMTVGPVRTRRLVSSYFDTNKRKLAGAGVFLRVRRKDGAYVQTLKADAAAGGLVRREIEHAVPGPMPDLTLIRTTEFGDLLGKSPDIAEVFCTDFQRTERMLLAPSGCLVSLAIDEGAVRAGGREVPISESELELKSGAPATLIAIARPLVEAYALSVSLTSKAECGLMAAEGGEIRAVKAEALHLSPAMTIGEALQTVIGAGLRHVSANQAAVLAGQSAGVHQMRVALRRLRSAFRAFRPVLETTVYAGLDERAKVIANALGPARDFDVFADAIVRPAQKALDEERSFAQLSGEVAERRAAAWEEARATVQSKDYRVFLLDLASLALCGVPGAAVLVPARPFAAAVLDERLAKAAKRGEKVDKISVSERHELRKDLKKLRYAADFFASLFPSKGQDRFFDALTELQEELGALNDIATARVILARLSADVARAGDAGRAAEFGLLAGEIAGWHIGRSSGSVKRLRTVWEKLAEGRPFWTERDPVK